jgi:hypothetical protein
MLIHDEEILPKTPIHWNQNQLLYTDLNPFERRIPDIATT